MATRCDWITPSIPRPWDVSSADKERAPAPSSSRTPSGARERPSPRARLRRAPGVHQGRRQGDCARPGPRRPTCQGPVQERLPLQEGQRAVHCCRGGLLGAVPVLREEGHARDRQHAPAWTCAGGNNYVQRRGQGRGPRQDRKGLEIMSLSSRHDKAKGTTTVRLPSGVKKTLKSLCRAVVGIAAGGGRLDKPMLKAGRAYHKYRVKRNSWPKVRGVAMNPVEHPRTVEVTTSTSVTLPQVAAPMCQDKRWVLLLRVALDVCVVRRRSWTKSCCLCHLTSECL